MKQKLLFNNETLQVSKFLKEREAQGLNARKMAENSRELKELIR